MECAACGQAVKDAVCPTGCPRALAQARLQVNITVAVDDGTAEASEVPRAFGGVAGCLLWERGGWLLEVVAHLPCLPILGPL